MPTLGFHVPEDSPLLKEVQSRASDHHDGKVSAYVRAAIERDLAAERSHGAAGAMSANVLVDLCRPLLGELDAEKMAEAMEGKDQREQLKRLLRALLDNAKSEAIETSSVDDRFDSESESRSVTLPQRLWDHIDTLSLSLPSRSAYMRLLAQRDIFIVNNTPRSKALEAELMKLRPEPGTEEFEEMVRKIAERIEEQKSHKGIPQRTQKKSS